MADFIVGGIVLIVIAAAVRYIYKAKKSGVKCIGCSQAQSCAMSKTSGESACSACSGCSGSCSSK